MLTLVAAPMRRTGALTVPDFAEARLGSPALRRLCAVVVLVIGCLYLVPQFTAAGHVLTLVSGTPYWVGVVVAGAAASVTLALGGMRAATYVQAFQFALKLVLFIVPAVWLLVAVGPQVRVQALHPVEFTTFTQPTAVDFTLDTRLQLTEPVTVRIDGGPPVPLPPGEHTAAAGMRWEFPAGAAVPRIDGAAVPGSAGWQRPLLDADSSGHLLLGTWSVLMATALGTMGLPHVLVRFHTSPDGRSARRTAAITVALLGAFYLFPGVYGLLGAVLLPELYLSGATDTVVVALPSRVDPGWSGDLFTALLTAGAFAAFLATSLGLLLAVSGAVAHDLIPATLRRLRLTALAAAAVVVLFALPAARVDVGALVTSAFAVGGVDVLPAARARHLVAAADGAGRARGDGRRAGQLGRGDGDRVGGGAPPGGAGAAAGPAGAVVGAARVRDDGRGLAARLSAAGRHVRDAAVAPRRDPPGTHPSVSLVTVRRQLRPFVGRSSIHSTGYPPGLSPDGPWSFP
jgi:Na+(H+)/acetate symporter ActP